MRSLLSAVSGRGYIKEDGYSLHSRRSIACLFFVLGSIIQLFRSLSFIHRSVSLRSGPSGSVCSAQRKLPVALPIVRLG